MLSAPNKLTAGRFSPAISPNGITFATYVAIVCLLLWPTVISMIGLWASSSSAHHGFLVAPVVLWMTSYGRRSTAPAAIWPLVSIGILLASATWLAGEAANANILQHLAFVSMIVFGAALFFGPARTRDWVLPLLLLFLMAPVGDNLSPALQSLAAKGSVILLNLVGIEASLAGALILTPTGPFLVAEACAGVNFLFAAILIASVIAWRATPNRFHQTIFIACAALTAIIANVFRAALIMALDNYADGRFSISADHFWAGWILYSILFILFVFVGYKILNKKTEKISVTDHAATHTSGFHLAALAISLIPIAGVNLYAHHFLGNSPTHELADEPPPLRAAGWRLVPLDTHQRRISFPSADGQVEAHYTLGKTSAQIAVSYYTHDRPNAEIGDHSFSALPSHWIKTGERKNAFNAFGKALTLTIATIGDGSGETLNMMTVYWVDSEAHSSRTSLKLALMRKRLMGSSPSGGSIVITTPGQQDIADLAFLLNDLEPIEAWLKRFETRTTH